MPGSLTHPEGSSPLSAHVSGAAELAAALSGVGIVDSAAEAQVMQPSLLPGQALTTREGGLWRWDGFVRRSAAQDSSAERIRQRRRLEGLQAEFATASQAETGLLADLQSAGEALATAREALTTTNGAATDAEAALASARQAQDGIRLRLDRPGSAPQS